MHYLPDQRTTILPRLNETTDDVLVAKVEKISILSEDPLATPWLSLILTKDLLESWSMSSSITESMTPDFPILTVIGSSELEDSLTILVGILDILMTSERRTHCFGSIAYSTGILN